MIVLTNTTQQTLEPGQVLAFDRTVLHTGCGECHREGTATVYMRQTDGSVYELYFNGNVTAAEAGEISLATGGAPLPETGMAVVAQAAETDFVNVGAATAVQNLCGYYDNVSVVNTGTTPVTVDVNACLFVKRVG